MVGESYQYINEYISQVNNSSYAKLSDEQLVHLANKNNKSAFEYLICRYKNLVRAKARAYFLIGADKEDIIQEGMIGLFKAIRDYKQERNVTFSAFADVCVTRQVITAVKNATRLKHRPLNTYVSLSGTPSDGDCILADFINKRAVANPEDVVISQESLRIMQQGMTDGLSKFELEVLQDYLQGASYQEIADSLGKQIKSIDNALQRIKKKIGNIMQDIQTA